MAPIAEPLLEALAGTLTSPTAFLSKRITFRGPALSKQELVALMSVSLCTAAISIIAALCAFYWFVRMRRSFRHDLIMLLIQSDMMKALWLVVCPIAFFVKEPIHSNSAFCQVSGFFLTASIEASDISVLLIAIHTALSILQPRTLNGASGLHPYRYVAYAFWAVVPIILASIVPITRGKFENSGPHCYLPIRPLWYRRALSWIPRYVIFSTIIVSYAFLYFYVIFRYRHFGKAQRRVSAARSNHRQQGREHGHRRHHSSITSSSPLIVGRDLLDFARGSLAEDGDPRERQDSIPSTLSTLDSGEHTFIPRRFEHVRKSLIRWTPVMYGDSTASQAKRQSQPAVASPTSPLFRAVEETLVSAPQPVHRRSLSLTQQSEQNCFRWKRSMSSGSNSITSSVSNIMNTFQRGTSLPDGADQPSPSDSTYLSREEFEDAVRQSREKMQRQLRLLFVYPGIYLLTWIAPFVSHVVRYNDENSTGPTNAPDPPFALLLTSLISLCIGAAVDCCFFSLWEKPWLHLRGGFWECLVWRVRIQRPMRHRSRGVGRTREERFMDAQTARVRREQETLDNINNEAATGGKRNSYRMHHTAPREWWDALDVDLHDTSSERLV
ncbi:hypothetical protein Hte_005722 [Hypoxylon texense]